MIPVPRRRLLETTMVRHGGKMTAGRTKRMSRKQNVVVPRRGSAAVHCGTVVVRPKLRLLLESERARRVGHCPGPLLARLQPAAKSRSSVVCSRKARSISEAVGGAGSAPFLSPVGFSRFRTVPNSCNWECLFLKFGTIRKLLLIVWVWSGSWY